MSLTISLDIDVDTGGDEEYSVNLHLDSISHSYAALWVKLGAKYLLYECSGKLAGDLSSDLSKHIDEMLSNSHRYIDLVPRDEYSDFDTAVTYLGNLYRACKSHPNATVSVTL